MKKVKPNVIMVGGDREVMSEKEDVIRVKRHDEVKSEKEKLKMK